MVARSILDYSQTGKSNQTFSAVGLRSDRFFIQCPEQKKDARREGFFSVFCLVVHTFRCMNNVSSL